MFRITDEWAAWPLRRLQSAAPAPGTTLLSPLFSVHLAHVDTEPHPRAPRDAETRP